MCIFSLILLQGCMDIIDLFQRTMEGIFEKEMKGEFVVTNHAWLRKWIGI